VGNLLNVVLIGYGYWGTNVARNIAAAKNTRLCAICDSSEAKLEKAKATYLDRVEYSSDYKKYLHDPNIDAFALVIQTEPSYWVAMEIINAGKHLFIEKPMAVNAGRAEELMLLAKENGVIIHCDHIMVFHPIIRYVKKMYDEGELGELIYFDISRINLGPIRMDVNSMLDLAVHDLAVIDYISGGKEPYHIEAMGEKRFGEQETLTYLTMKYDGFIAHVKSSWISPLKERRMIIAGTKKMVVFDDMKLVDKLTIYDHGIVPIESGEDYGAYEFKVRTGDILIPYIQHEDALKLSVEHFGSCVQERRPSLAGPEQAVRVIKILDKAVEKLALDY
jgi:predicted dehydrogenase